MAVLGADDVHGDEPGVVRPSAHGTLGEPVVLRAWAAGARTASGAARERVDAVNVFPVADADTGSNVHLTVTGGADAVARLPDDADAVTVAAAFADGAAQAARGSSGVIVSQWIAGLAEAVGDGADLAGALDRAAVAARAAVADPQEGTVLTVARDVARGTAVATGAGVAPLEALASATRAARTDLGRVSAGHDVLRAAHVVDAGACALLVLLDALAHALRTRSPAGEGDLDLTWLPTGAPVVGAAHAHGGSGAYEVVLQVRPDASAAAGAPGDAAALTAALGGVGDAVAVAAVGGRLHAHVHTDDPAAALALVPAAAREQVVVRAVDAGADDGPALVVLTPSPGLAAWYTTAGAVTLVAEPGTTVTPAHVARVVSDAGDGPVLVLDVAGAVPQERADAGPGGGGGVGTTAAAVLPASHDGVAVVACLAALADPSGGAAAARAVLDRLRADQVPHDAAPGASPSAVGRTVDALVAGGAPPQAVTPAPQAVTLVHGSDVVAATADATARAVRTAHPELEVVVVGPAHGSGWWVGVD